MVFVVTLIQPKVEARALHSKAFQGIGILSLPLIFRKNRGFRKNRKNFAALEIVYATFFSSQTGFFARYKMKNDRRDFGAKSVTKNDTDDVTVRLLNR